MFNLFVDHFNAVQFFNPVLSLSVSEFCFPDRASFPFSMAVICSPSCIVTAVAVRAVFINKKRNSQLAQVFLELELVLLSSAETVVCEQLNSTNYHIGIFRDNAFAFNFSNGVLKHLIMKLKPMRRPALQNLRFFNSEGSLLT